MVYKHNRSQAVIARTFGLRVGETKSADLKNADLAKG
jgi:hypothetical protein